jgi:hypothetical protein
MLRRIFRNYSKVSFLEMNAIDVHQDYLKNVTALKEARERGFKPQEGDFIVEKPSWSTKPNLKFNSIQGIEIYQKLKFSPQEIEEIKEFSKGKEIYEKFEKIKEKMEEKMFQAMKDFGYQQNRTDLSRFKYQLGKLSIHSENEKEYKTIRENYYREIISNFFDFQFDKKFNLPIQTATSYAFIALSNASKKNMKIEGNHKERHEEEMKLLSTYDEKNKTNYHSTEGWIHYKLQIEDQFYQAS